MSASYWKMIGDRIASGLGEKAIRRLGVGGKALGRTGMVVGIGFLAYEFVKSYKQNIEKEPAYKEMKILQTELEKWTSAISCLGREPLAENKFGSFDEGGAINALHPKKALKGGKVKPANPQEAYTLIGRSMNYIRHTENLLRDDRFEKKTKELVSRLRQLQLKISELEDYRPIQRDLGQIVDEIRPIAAGYSSRIYDCSREIQKTLGSNAAWAAISMTTLGLVKKPPSPDA
jgi:hypothetical protein